MSLYLSGRDVEGDRRRGVEVVAGTLVAHPGTAVARPPEREVGLPDRRCRSPTPARRRSSTDRLCGTSLPGSPNANDRSATLPRRSRRHAAPAADAHFAAGGRPSTWPPAISGATDMLATLLSATRRSTRSCPVFAFSATSTASPAAKNTLSPIRATPRLVRGAGSRPRATGGDSATTASRLRVERDGLIARRRDEHHTVVDDGWRFVTVGHAVENDQTGCNRVTFAGVICSSGLYPHPGECAASSASRRRRGLQSCGVDQLVVLKDRGHRRRRRRRGLRHVGAQRGQRNSHQERDEGHTPHLNLSRTRRVT